MRCAKCGSQIFLVDETITHLEINGEIVKELGTGDLHNRNCLRCTEPDIYDDYAHLDERTEDAAATAPTSIPNTAPARKAATRKSETPIEPSPKKSAMDSARRPKRGKAEAKRQGRHSEKK